MTDQTLIEDFDQAMYDIYTRALLEAAYRATRFHEMLFEHRGVGTARILLHARKVSEGYTALWERGRLDLTVEAVILENAKWHSLFTPEELEVCRKRLQAYDYPKKSAGRDG